MSIFDDRIRLSPAACRSSICKKSMHDPQIDIWYFDIMSHKGLYNFRNQSTSVVTISRAAGQAIELADQCFPEKMILNRPPRISVY